MFGSKNTKNNDTSRTVSMSGSTNSLNSLVKGTRIEGTIYSDNDIRIDGGIKGNLVCKAKVIIGPTGVIEGEITCQSAMIEGQFDGKITVEELLNVRETAKINGEVKTNKLIVQSGAEFNVTCVMGALKAIKANAAPTASSSNVKTKSSKETRGVAKAM